MIIGNAQEYEKCFKASDFYIFAIGYEHRSFYLLDYLLERFPLAKKLIFLLNDYTKYPHVVEKVAQLREKNIHFHEVDYLDGAIIQTIISDTVSLIKNEEKSISIHIDYSSMPRSWYCNMPITLSEVISEDDIVYFWYSEGEYPDSHEEYPSAGIDSFSLFSGKPSLRIDGDRIHVLALGYDLIRTQAILSITDPNYLVSCMAYDPKRKGFLKSLRDVNVSVLARSAMTLSLHVDDFEFMVSKMCETANELVSTGDVILIPDGPKPLIFAMSLVPYLLNKVGITCLHITRNKEHFSAVDVEPTGVVCGFKVQKKKRV